MLGWDLKGMDPTWTGSGSLWTQEEQFVDSASYACKGSSAGTINKLPQPEIVLMQCDFFPVL